MQSPHDVSIVVQSGTPVNMYNIMFNKDTGTSNDKYNMHLVRLFDRLVKVVSF